MKRGDVVTVAVSGDFGKSRPAVVIQTDAIPPAHTSVIVCQMTTSIENAPDLRLTIEPHKGNGLRERSQIMADKPVTIRRERIAKKIGKLTDDEITHLNSILAFVMGLAD